jgi:hypothetical protein
MECEGLIAPEPMPRLYTRTADCPGSRSNRHIQQHLELENTAVQHGQQITLSNRV